MNFHSDTLELIVKSQNEFILKKKVPLQVSSGSISEKSNDDNNSEIEKLSDRAKIDIKS